MPRARKSNPKPAVKTALELALEEEVKPKRTRRKRVTTPKTTVKQSPKKESVKSPVRRKRKEAVESPKQPEFVPYEPPKQKFCRKRIRYNEGDRVEIVYAGDTYTGELTCILSSQLVIKTDDGKERFFFQSGINIKRLKKGNKN